MATVIRRSDYRARPWRNGGGETLDILVHPAHASLDTFEWRISMARVERDGPFSAFDGVDRTLLVLSGALLLSGEHGTVRLASGAAPFSFDGGRVLDAVVERGPVVDLNVMTRRGHAAHRVSCRRLEAAATLAPLTGVLAVFALEPGLLIDTWRLAAHDTAIIGADGTPAQVRNTQPLPAVLIEIC